jgi:hypothetical protein
MIHGAILEKLKILNYSASWLDKGILTEHELEKQIQQFRTGKDNNTEHYRYRTFKNYLKEQLSVNDLHLKHLLQILKEDNDVSMSGSATIELLNQSYLTEEQFEMVADFLRTYGEHMEKYITKVQSLRSN